MTATQFIDRPGETVTIDSDFHGDVRCRILTVKKGGSFTGNAVADEIRVAGTFAGTAFSPLLWAVPGSCLRGTYFCGRYRIETDRFEGICNPEVGMSPAAAYALEALEKGRIRPSDAARAVMGAAAARTDTTPAGQAAETTAATKDEHPALPAGTAARPAPLPKAPPPPVAAETALPARPSRPARAETVTLPSLF